MDFCRRYLDQVAEIARQINPAAVAELVDRLRAEYVAACALPSLADAAREAGAADPLE